VFGRAICGSFPSFCGEPDSQTPRTARKKKKKKKKRKKKKKTKKKKKSKIETGTQKQKNENGQKQPKEARAKEKKQRAPGGNLATGALRHKQGNQIEIGSIPPTGGPPFYAAGFGGKNATQLVRELPAWALGQPVVKVRHRGNQRSSPEILVRRYHSRPGLQLKDTEAGQRKCRWQVKAPTTAIIRGDLYSIT